MRFFGECCAQGFEFCQKRFFLFGEGTRALGGKPGGAVPHRFLTVAAVAAGRGVDLSEIMEDVAAQALAGAAVFRHRFQPGKLALERFFLLGFGERRIRFGVRQQPVVGAHVHFMEEEHAFGGTSVPAGASRLLIIGFDAGGHVVM